MPVAMTIVISAMSRLDMVVLLRQIGWKDCVSVFQDPRLPASLPAALISFDETTLQEGYRSSRTLHRHAPLFRIGRQPAQCSLLPPELTQLADEIGHRLPDAHDHGRTGVRLAGSPLGDPRRSAGLGLQRDCGFHSCPGSGQRVGNGIL